MPSIQSRWKGHDFCRSLDNPNPEQFLRTTDGAIGAIHAPYWCDDNVAAAAGYAAEALWKNICKHNSTAPVTHDCYLKLFYLQGRDWSGRPDLNRRPHAPQACALPGCATPRPEELRSHRCGPPVCSPAARAAKVPAPRQYSRAQV